MMNDEDYCHIVQRETGFYIIDFYKVELDMEAIAKVFGPFVSNEAAVGFWDKYLSSGYSAETGILFMNEESE